MGINPRDLPTSGDYAQATVDEAAKAAKSLEQRVLTLEAKVTAQDELTQILRDTLTKLLRQLASGE